MSISASPCSMIKFLPYDEDKTKTDSRENSQKFRGMVGMEVIK